MPVWQAQWAQLQRPILLSRCPSAQRPLPGSVVEAQKGVRNRLPLVTMRAPVRADTVSVYARVYTHGSAKCTHMPYGGLWAYTGTHGTKWEAVGQRGENQICRRRDPKELGAQTTNTEAMLRRPATLHPRRRSHVARRRGGAGDWACRVVMSGHANRFGHIGNEGAGIVVSADRRKFAG
jgi:hypothetical protein